MTLEDALNTRFQELLYALIDSKSDGLRDCTVTEVVNVAAVAFTEAGKDCDFQPGSIRATRCIACGQIDEPEHHDNAACPATKGLSR